MVGAGRVNIFKTHTARAPGRAESGEGWEQGRLTGGGGEKNGLSSSRGRTPERGWVRGCGTPSAPEAAGLPPTP